MNKLTVFITFQVSPKATDWQIICCIILLQKERINSMEMLDRKQKLLPFI